MTEVKYGKHEQIDVNEENKDLRTMYEEQTKNPYYKLKGIKETITK